MKTGYFLTQEQDLHRFDALWTELDILITAVPVEQIASLTAFIAREKPIVQQDYLVLDVSGGNWTTAHILSAVQQLRRFSSARLIFLGGPDEETVELYGALANVHHVQHLIMQQPDTDVETELRSCLQDGPQLPRKLRAMQEELVQTAVRAASPLRVPDGLICEIAAAGTMPRCGVTMQSFALYHYLKAHGWRPAIRDMTGRTLKLLQMFEQAEQQDDGVTVIHGVPFCGGAAAQFNAYVLDYGMLTPENSAHFCAADVCVLVGCTKPWELPAFADALKLVMSHPSRNLITLASFSTQRDLDRLAKYFGDRSGLAPYHPDPWEPSAPQVYDALLLPALRELCGSAHDEDAAQ